MNNVPLKPETYRNAREYLRTNEILYRDMRQVTGVPVWGEALCLEEILHQGQTPGQIAYNALRGEFPKVRLEWREEELKLLQMSPPKLFRPFVDQPVYGLDIVKAYAQLYQRLYLHSDWPNKRNKYPLAQVAVSLWELKAARNAVVGIAISTRNKWVLGQKVWYQDKYNRYLSPTLWGQLQTILHQIARVAADNGAIHINTDGYVFETRKERDLFHSWLSDKGIVTRLYQGIGRAPGLNSLEIDGCKTTDRPGERGRVVNHIINPEWDALSWWVGRKP